LTDRAIKLSLLLRDAGIEPLGASDVDPLVRGVTLDSRMVETDQIFVAVQGLQSDGETFVPDAVRRGARAVVAASPRPAALDPQIAWVRVDDPRRAAALLAREFFARPDEALTLVGITGTNGKTTVAYLLEAIAVAAGHRAGRIGTVGYAFGNVSGAGPRTTPEAPELYRLLAEMRDETIGIVAAEVSSHALALKRVEGARFAAAAFLNLSRDHLDFHESEQAYFEAKARLFEPLGPDQHAVLPADTEYGKELGQRSRARVITFGRSAGSTVRLRDERHGIDGSSAVLETPSGSLPVRTFLLGRVNLDNVAAAAACALALELPPMSIPDGVLSLQSVPGRMERIDRGQPFTLIVDYAHTEEALDNLLRGLRELIQGRLLVVFGCGGDRDRGKRPHMGRIAVERADRVYLTSDNPRSEDPLRILDEVKSGTNGINGSASCCALIADRRNAIYTAVADADPGDVVVVAGKGHETTQTIGKQVLPFDDRVVAAAALEQLGWSEERHAGA
jgi:UDP-N-acetylmuramoyl-L-alanyl-D-glutamate--2,6-diaminopimelate ligase